MLVQNGAPVLTSRKLTRKVKYEHCRCLISRVVKFSVNNLIIFLWFVVSETISVGFLCRIKQGDGTIVRRS